MYLDFAARGPKQELQLNGCFYNSICFRHFFMEPFHRCPGNACFGSSSRRGRGLAVSPLVELPVRTRAKVLDHFQLPATTAVGIQASLRLGAGADGAVQRSCNRHAVAAC